MPNSPLFINEQLKNAIDSFYDIVYIVIDEFGHIIYPQNVHESNRFTLSLNKSGPNNEYYNSFWDKYYHLDISHYEQGGHKYEVRRYMEITKYKKQINNLEIDETTRIYQKRKIYEEFRTYIEEALSTEKDFSVIMADADFFKKVNDTYGHPVGDDVLNSIAQTIARNIRHGDSRPCDLLGRVGGEEFLFILKNIKPEISLRRVDEIRRIISTKPIISGDSVVNITMSFGVAHFPYQKVRELSKTDSIDGISKKLIMSADQALYTSKTTGRNKVSMFNS